MRERRERRERERERREMREREREREGKEEGIRRVGPRRTAAPNDPPALRCDRPIGWDAMGWCGVVWL